jgi:recombination protein RecR
MQPLAQALGDAAEAILVCGSCGNLDTVEPCGICMDEKRDGGTICVIEDVADLWALERTRSFKGRYHVLGGRLSALDGIGPEDLNIAGLVARAETGDIQEVILAMNLTVDGQTTAHYIADRLGHTEVDVTRLAHGVPVGGELDYLDDGTLETALRSRRSVG